MLMSKSLYPVVEAVADCLRMCHRTAPFQAEMVEFIIAERLQHPHAFSYLVNSYVRAEGLFKMLRDSDVKVAGLCTCQRLEIKPEQVLTSLLQSAMYLNRTPS